MASSARIDGSLPDPGDNSTKGVIFSGAWGVQYEFAGTPPIRANQPQRLLALGFPPPFDRDLEGALRGRGAFSAFLYLFKDGNYIRLVASTMTPDGPNAVAATAPAWGLPATWTHFDAVLPGRGNKINFCYFFRGAEYIRFDWTANAVSPGYPKLIGPEWHLGSPFDANVDGVIAGQSDLATRGLVFTTLQLVLNDAGAVVPAGTPGSKLVRTPGFGRYDFNLENSQGTVTTPRDVNTKWGGLIPLLDAGPAIDLALAWCKRAQEVMNGPPTPILANAFAHHFRTSSPSPAQRTAIVNRLSGVQARLVNLPSQFQWTRGFSDVAGTVAGVVTHLGDDFSNLHGPNGRAAVLIHEAVHFVFSGSPSVDVPEWSGETINGQTFGVSPIIPGVDVSGIPYAALTTEQAIANPGSYASFVQEIAFNGNDARFGIARRHE
jgi:hypothetical protein